MLATQLLRVSSVSGPLESALQSQFPDLSLPGGSGDGPQVPDAKASARRQAWAEDPCHSWALVTHRPLTAPPRGVALAPVCEQEANKTNWKVVALPPIN